MQEFSEYKKTQDSIGMPSLPGRREHSQQLEEDWEEKPEQQQYYHDISNSSSNFVGHWDNPLRIKEALFAQEGDTIVVKGQIISAGKIHSVLFPANDGSGFTTELRAIRVELMDVEHYNAIDSLSVILSNELAQDVRIGENLIVAGIVKLERQNKQIALPRLYAHDVRYIKEKIDISQQEEEESLRPHEIERVHRFIRLATQEPGNDNDDNNVIDRLVSIYAKKVVKNENIKEGLLYALSSVTANLRKGGDVDDRRTRLNIGLIGFPGGGKTYTAKTVLKYNSRARFETAQSSSAKSLTAIITNEGEGKVLRVGSVAHARQSLCVIDEIGELPISEQALLQGVMEEGAFTLNKFGFNANIRADTVIVWTTNPKNATNANSHLSFKDLPIRKQILDRTDLLIVQKAIVEPEEREEFNRLKLEYERATDARKKILSYYDDYINLHLAVMKRKYSNQDMTMTKECAELINKADVEIQKRKAEGAGSFRTIDTLIRLTEVIAKLKLKDVADVNDANRAIAFYNKVSTVNMMVDKEE